MFKRGDKVTYKDLTLRCLSGGRYVFTVVDYGPHKTVVVRWRDGGTSLEYVPNLQLCEQD